MTQVVVREVYASGANRAQVELKESASLSRVMKHAGGREGFEVFYRADHDGSFNFSNAGKVFVVAPNEEAAARYRLGQNILSDRN